MIYDKQRPAFNDYHSGPWPYDWEDGVGMALTGRPIDPFRLIDILHENSCSPIAARRILEELEAGRTKYTTVRAHLPFNDIGRQLASVGVTLKIVEPRPNAETMVYDQAALDLLLGYPKALEGFTQNERTLIEASYQFASASMARLPHNLGAYAD